MPAPIQPDSVTNDVLQQRNGLLQKMRPVTDEMLASPPDGDWLHWLRTYDQHGFSPLKQITKENVDRLKPAWTWSLPPGTGQTTPLVHDGVIYILGPNDRVQAFDAEKGDLLWEALPKEENEQATQVKRNMAIYGTTLYVPTVRNTMLALDARTGKTIWDQPIAGAGADWEMTSGPLVAKGKIIQGATHCTTGCFIFALDATTGKEVWRFRTVAQPGEPGGNSWNGLPAERRPGAGVWSTASYDPKLNLVYLGTGNNYAWQELVKGASPGNKQKGVTTDGLYMDSTLALDLESGKLKWYFQHIHLDMWNLDTSFEHQLIDLPVDGKPRRLVVTAGKIAIFDALDAATGKFVFAKDLGIQNIVASIDPVTGRKTYNPQSIPDMKRTRTSMQCPAGFGARSYPSNAYNPNAKTVYVAMAEVCGEVIAVDTSKPDYVYKGGAQEIRIPRLMPGSDGKVGRLDAVNLETRQITWTVRQRAPFTSATLATDGGLVFAGDLDRMFRAYDGATGNVLWETRLNDIVSSYPISYSVNGKQYIAVVAGVAGPRVGNLNRYTTEIKAPSGGGATLWVFELPKH